MSRRIAILVATVIALLPGTAAAEPPPAIPVPAPADLCRLLPSMPERLKPPVCRGRHATPGPEGPSRDTGPSGPGDVLCKPFGRLPEWARPLPCQARDIPDKIVRQLLSALPAVLVPHPTPADATSFGTRFIAGLIRTPNYVAGPTGAVGRRTAAVALGLLGATMTFAALQMWLSGLSLSGGGSVLTSAEGMVRGVGAALFIVLWPWLFKNGINLANVVSHAILDTGLHEDAAKLLQKGLLLSSLGAPTTMMSLGLIIGVGFIIVGMGLFFALLLLKIATGAALGVLFVGMPIAVALWVLPSLAWIARLISRVTVAIALIPVLWAVCFATFTGMLADASLPDELFPGRTRDGGLVTILFDPLIAIALLFLLLQLPRMLLRVAMLGGMIQVSPIGGLIDKAGDVLGKILPLVQRHMQHQERMNQSQDQHDQKMSQSQAQHQERTDQSAAQHQDRKFDSYLRDVRAGDQRMQSFFESARRPMSPLKPMPKSEEQAGQQEQPPSPKEAQAASRARAVGQEVGEIMDQKNGVKGHHRPDSATTMEAAGTLSAAGHLSRLRDIEQSAPSELGFITTGAQISAGLGDQPEVQSAMRTYLASDASDRANVWMNRSLLPPEPAGGAPRPEPSDPPTAKPAGKS